MKKIIYLFLCAICLIYCSGCQSLQSNLEIYCFEAGKADSFLITTENYTVLLDTGEKDLSDTILDYLDEKNIDSIDYMIITHFDKDHVGGAGSVLKNIEVKKVYQSDYPKDSSEYEKYIKFINKKDVDVVTVSQDVTLDLDGITFTINGPEKEEYSTDSSNNSSLIVSIQDDACSYLFMGDSEDERIEEFISQNNQSYDVIKIPYHGHYQDSLEELLDNTNPEYAIITSSDDEQEDSETTDLLNSKNIKTYLTRDGAITIKCDGKTIQFT